MSSAHPVIAVIPNYNHGESLQELLPQVLEQEYDGVIVCDDASTDGSLDFLSPFRSDIEIYRGTDNVGAGANRNRILQSKTLEHLGSTTLIHFIDADMKLETKRVPELARELLSEVQLGFVGGLIKTLDGKQHPFNFGPRQCLRTDVLSHLQLHVWKVAEHDPGRFQKIRERYKSLLADWPDPLSQPKARPVFWNAESNLLMPSVVFEKFGGFDPQLRDHEIQDLAIRLHNKGLERRFDPSLSAIHKAVTVRTGNRNLEMAKAELQIARKHGFRNFVLPDGKFKPEL